MYNYDRANNDIQQEFGQLNFSPGRAESDVTDTNIY